MRNPARYRSPYRKNQRENQHVIEGSDIRERIIFQGIVCGVVLAALLTMSLTRFPLTEGLKKNVMSLIRIDYTQDLPLEYFTNIFERARYSVFGELPQIEESVDLQPIPEDLPTEINVTEPATQTPQHENTILPQREYEERLFIEDIIRRVYEAGNTPQENLTPEHTDNPENDSKSTPDGFGANLLGPAIPPGSARVSSPFGDRLSPFTGETEFHNGIDMAFAYGTPVVAIQDGVIISIGYNASSGNYLRYMTSEGLLVGYGHLYRALVDVGDVVRQGDTVALTGNSGFSTAPHLHVSIWEDDILIDPLTVFSVN